MRQHEEGLQQARARELSFGAASRAKRRAELEKDRKAICGSLHRDTEEVMEGLDIDGSMLITAQVVLRARNPNDEHFLEHEVKGDVLQLYGSCEVREVTYSKSRAFVHKHTVPWAARQRLSTKEP